jgi:hypothetical protein
MASLQQTSNSICVKYQPFVSTWFITLHSRLNVRPVLLSLQGHVNDTAHISNDNLNEDNEESFIVED